WRQSPPHRWRQRRRRPSRPCSTRFPRRGGPVLPAVVPGFPLPSLGLPRLGPRLRARAAGGGFHAALEILQATAQRLVDGVEGSCRFVCVLADLVREPDKLLEARAVADLLAEVLDETGEVVGHLFDVFQRCHRWSPFGLRTP